MTDPSGNIHYDPGAGRGAAPAFSPSAGLYVTYLNRLPIGQANAGTDPALLAAIQAQLARSQAPVTNGYIDPAAAAQASARGQMQGAIGNLQGAGQGNAAAQGLVGGMGMANSQQVRGQEQGLAGLLTQGALGGGPSAAQAQFQSSLDQNIAAQHALAAGARGQGAAAAMRGATNQGVQLGLQSQAQAAALRAQEQQAAQAALGNVLGNTRAGDINSVYALGNLASTGRAQDIGQAGAVTDAFGNVRTGDVNAGATFGGLGNQLLGLNMQNQGMGIDAALREDQLRRQGLGMDISALLSGGQMMANYDQGVRGQNIETRGQDIGLGTSIAGGIMGLGSAGLGYLGSGLGAPTGAAPTPTAGSADWLAQSMARR
jgi:hypothetical protein